MRYFVLLIALFISSNLASQELEKNGYENQFGFKYDKEWFRVINSLTKNDFSGIYRFESGTERNIMLSLNCIDQRVLVQYYTSDMKEYLGKYRIYQEYHTLNNAYVYDYRIITKLFKLEFYIIDNKAYSNKIKKFHEDLGNNYNEDDEINHKLDTVIYITPDYFYSQTLGFKYEATDMETFFSGKYPEVSYRKLTEEELSSKSKQELRIMRNELFARYGHAFKEGGEMDKNFREQDWYYPYRKGEDVSKQFSFLERENLNKIIEYEKLK